MGFSSAAPNPSFIFDRNVIKERSLEIARFVFNSIPNKTENLEFARFANMPKTKKAAQNIVRVLNRIIDNWVVKTNWTLSDYEALIEERDCNPEFKPNGVIASVLVMVNDCLTQAYLTEMSSRPDFWSNLSDLERQDLLNYFNELMNYYPPQAERVVSASL